MPVYELTYIARPELDEAALTAVTDRIVTQIQAAGGQVLSRRVMGRRHLAYPIQKIQDGTYALLLLDLPNTAVRVLERNLGLNENLLRHLVVRAEAPPPGPAAETAPAPGASETPPAASAPAPEAQPLPPAPTDTASPASDEKTTPAGG